MVTINYIGNFQRDWNTEAHIARDARTLGHQVQEHDEREIAALLKIDVAGALERLDGVALVIYTKTHGLPESARTLWRALEEAGTSTASIHLDLYRGLRRQREVGHDPFWSTGLVCTADGDPSTHAYLERLGIRHHWFPPAVVSDEAILVEHPEGTYDEWNKLRGRLVFVGSTGTYHPEWPWREHLLYALTKRYKGRFEMYGPSAQHGRVTRGFDLNRLYQTPGVVVVGDSLALKGHRNYWSDRYFETIGRGGFLVAPEVAGLDAFLTEGEHYRGYRPGDTTTLFPLIDQYLEDPNEAMEIAEKGRRHVAEHHTYRDRMRALLQELGL